MFFSGICMVFHVMIPVVDVVIRRGFHRYWRTQYGVKSTSANDVNDGNPRLVMIHGNLPWVARPWNPAQVRYSVFFLRFLIKKSILTHTCAFLGVNSKNEDRGPAGFCRPNCRGTFTYMVGGFCLASL